MLFSSLEFLFLFLPMALGLYYLAPRSWRNGILLLESLVFYAWGEPSLVVLMLTVALLHYGLGLWMEHTRRRKLLMAATAVLDLAILIYFKYTDFLRGLLGWSPLGILLPLGISFYLFQALSYVADVYRGETEACKSPVRFGAYLTFFPQLVAGPIVRYSDLRDALARRRETLSDVAEGFVTFSAGLCKKVLLANSAGAIWDAMRGLTAEHGSPVTAWMGLVCFGLQIYYDFSGYSDMAVGLGRMFGFLLPQNFDYPYTARSVREFWHRWHITLSAWFREYVYIPLGG
ncbi:MAG: MBOAT family protein, partial [Clostridia bacterium]|nr:MBOAT family protein [Clostridia bacterium]